MGNMGSIQRITILISALFRTAASQVSSFHGDEDDPFNPLVDLGYVKYRGYSNLTAGINYFKGIHYAASPSGTYRWRKPRPIEWNNGFDTNSIYNATDHAAPCIQTVPEPYYALGFNEDYSSDGQSEDCLTLDVLAPTHRQSEYVPVVVLIHGGGYDQGGSRWFQGESMVNASNGGILWVNIQYRLGMLGFLGGSDVAHNGVRNAGLLDQRAALEWVQRNIRSFGGDPAKVTIWGGSAGGGSVTAQLIAGGAFDEPPFTAAIAEYPWWQPFINETQQDITYRYALQLSQCTTITCLRSLPTEQIIVLAQAVLNASYPGPGAVYGSYYFGPVVDDRFILDLPSQEFARGHFHDIPLIVGHSVNEGSIFVRKSYNTQVAATDDAELLFPFAGPGFLSRLYNLYPRSAYDSISNQTEDWFSDFIINCPTYHMAHNAIDRNSNTSAVWKMLFNAGRQRHGATFEYLCSNYTGFPEARNRTLAQIMSSYWMSFIVTQDPNAMRAEGAPLWPSYAGGGIGTLDTGEAVGFQTLEVRDGVIEAVVDRDAGEKCDFFASRAFQVQN